MNYLNWDEQIITDFSESNVALMYDRGYVFTRIGKGVMQQTRSVRIDLAKFSFTSENRRILKKVFDIEILLEPIPYKEYKWEIAKLAKDFYSARFGHGIISIMGAAKIKEILTDSVKSNYNSLFIYLQKQNKRGYAICYANKDIIHYSYPFYELDLSPTDMGLGMMIKAIEYAKNAGMKYVYLGSLQRPTDTYKLQFAGLEWFDGKAWMKDVEGAKKVIKEAARS